MKNATMDYETMPELLCPDCKDSNLFTPTNKIKYVSMVQSPTGQSGIAQLTVGVTCTKCGFFISAKDLLSATPMYPEDNNGKQG
jgi:hypothetical protein